MLNSDAFNFSSPDGLRFAKANSIEMLLANDFVIEINQKRFPVSVSNLSESFAPRIYYYYYFVRLACSRLDSLTFSHHTCFRLLQLKINDSVGNIII